MLGLMPSNAVVENLFSKGDFQWSFRMRMGNQNDFFSWKDPKGAILREKGTGFSSTPNSALPNPLKRNPSSVRHGISRGNWGSMHQEEPKKMPFSISQRSGNRTFS